MAEQSDLDRRSATRERAPVPRERGAVLAWQHAREGRRRAARAARSRPASPPPPSPPAERIPRNSRRGDLHRRKHNHRRRRRRRATWASRCATCSSICRDENYDNDQGGDTEQSADIQFDSKGVDFGPWLRRFKNQVERNWLIPESAEMTYAAVSSFSSTCCATAAITDLRVVQPAGDPALTSSALNALKLSNPTAALPPEYPADRVVLHRHVPLQRSRSGTGH